jgi:hypothetical protein
MTISIPVDVLAASQLPNHIPGTTIKKPRWGFGFAKHTSYLFSS